MPGATASKLPATYRDRVLAPEVIDPRIADVVRRRLRLVRLRVRAPRRLSIRIRRHHWIDSGHRRLDRCAESSIYIVGPRSSWHPPSLSARMLVSSSSKAWSRGSVHR